jgi:hypothetical protein
MGPMGFKKSSHRQKSLNMKTPTTSSAGIRVMMTLSTKLTAGDGRPLCENPGHLKREKMIFFGCNHEINVGESEKSWPSRIRTRGAANEGTFDT